MARRRIGLTGGIVALAGTAVLAVRAQRRTARELRTLLAEREQASAAVREATVALQRSDELLDSLIAGIPGAVFRCLPDDDWTAHFVTDAIEALTGHAASEFLGSCVRSMASVVHPDDLDAARAARTGAADGHPYSSEYRIRHADGSERWALERGRGVLGPDGELRWIDGVVFDATERRRLEEQLGQSGRLEAVGRLAGGVAHDFNNLLTAIHGYGELLAASLDPADQRREDALEIQRAADRANALVAQLLAFSRRQSLHPIVLDLNSLVAELAPMLRRLLGEDVELHTSLDPALGHVRADPARLEQVIVNLAVNARDAMRSGGTLTIETRNARDRGTSGFVGIRVSDTGAGMDASTLAHVFEPFFSTKTDRGGTGLGLATVYGIVTQSGGRILVDSQPGDGTTFTIHLPRVDGPVEQRPAVAALPAGRRGSEEILLVEDDEVVRTLARRVLDEHGYVVHEARNGADALAVVRALPAPVDLLVTDVVMPKLGGSELARSLRSTWPGLPTLYMSGYAQETVEPGTRAGSGFLAKPFTPAALIARVRELLDGRDRLAG